MTLRLLLLILFSSILISGLAQGDKLIPAKKLIKDLDQFVKLIEAHPDPYSHISKKEFGQLIADAKRKIRKPLSTVEFYKVMAPLSAAIKDGHTNLYMPFGWLKKVRKNNGVFPYKMNLTDDHQLYFIEFQGDHALANDHIIPLGSHVQEINGMSVDSFVSIIDPFVSYEKEYFRNVIIEDGFEGYLHLVFGSSNNVVFTYLADEVHKHEVKNINYEDWKRYIKNNKGEKEKAMSKGLPFQYQRIGNNIGLINIYSFAVADFAQYQHFLRNTFGKIEEDNVSSLIIDVRGNFGGYPKVASELLHYLTRKHFKTMAMSKLKISRPYRDYFIEKFNGANTLAMNFKRWRHIVDLEQVMHGKIGQFIIEDAFYNEPPTSTPYKFGGKVYLLTDRSSYSAAASFAATFKCYDFGQVIGSETGGTSIFHANAMSDRLNHSKMIFNVSTATKFTTCFNEDYEGIKPHIEYKPSVLDLVSKEDTHLNYLLFLINKYSEKEEAGE